MFAKRFVELQRLTTAGGRQITGRGYLATDLSIVATLGPAADYVAILALQPADGVSRTSPQTDHSASTVRADALCKSHLNFEETSSVGLRSGLYGGRQMPLSPAAAIASRTPTTFCTPRLSITTTSPD